MFLCIVSISLTFNVAGKEHGKAYAVLPVFVQEGEALNIL